MATLQSKALLKDTRSIALFTMKDLIVLVTQSRARKRLRVGVEKRRMISCDGCISISEPSSTVVPQRLHALAAGALLALAAIAFSHKHLSQRFRDVANLINRPAPMTPSLTALIATNTALETGTVISHGKTE